MEDRVLEPRENVEELKRQLDDSQNNQVKSVAQIRQRLNQLRSLATKMEEEIKNGISDGPDAR